MAKNRKYREISFGNFRKRHNFYNNFFLNKFLLKFISKNSDKINCQLWAGKKFSITKTQPESAISIGQFYWQGMHEIRMKFEYQRFQY